MLFAYGVVKWDLAYGICNDLIQLCSVRILYNKTGELIKHTVWVCKKKKNTPQLKQTYLIIYFKCFKSDTI